MQRQFPKNFIHKEFTAENIAIEQVAANILTLNCTFKEFIGLVKQPTIPECPPDARCFVIIIAVFHLYILIANHQGQSITLCKAAIKKFCQTDTFQTANKELATNTDLQEQLKGCCQLEPRQTKVSMNTVRKTTNVILAFIINVIIWRQNPHHK